jgi:archaellum component FlaC
MSDATAVKPGNQADISSGSQGANASAPVQSSSQTSDATQGASQSAAKAASPSVAERKEKTTKGMTNLIIEQIRSLIEINVALNGKVKEITAKLDSYDKGIKSINEQVKGFDDRISKIESNMEKFIGLYEIVTNKYNPFLEEDDKQKFQKMSEKDMFTGIDLAKLKDDAKKVISDIMAQEGKSASGVTVAVDDLTKNIEKTKGSVPNDVTLPEEELKKKLGKDFEKVSLDNFGIQKKDDAAPVVSNQDAELEKLSSEFHFTLKDGRMIKTLPELAMILDDMDNDTFSHHVNDQKNDFYEWIKHSMDPTFAEEIKSVKNKKDLKKTIMSHIQKVTSK